MSAALRTIDVAQVIEERRLSGFNYGLIAVSWLITVFDGFDMMMIGYTAPYMRETLALDELMLGNVFSAGLLGMMLGGIAGPILGGYLLASGLPVVRSFALLAICPAILFLCAISIGLIVRRRNRPSTPADVSPVPIQ